MEFVKILFLILFVNINVNNVKSADEFMSTIVGNKLLLFRVTDEERDKLLESMAKTEKEDIFLKGDTTFSLKNNFKTFKSSGEKIGNKVISEGHGVEDSYRKENGSNEHNEKKTKKDWSKKSKKDNGMKEDERYSSKIRRDKHEISDTGYRSHNRNKGHEFEKSWSSDKERGMKKSEGKTYENNGNHALVDKGSQQRLKKWSADDRKNEGSNASHGSLDSEGHHKNVGSHGKQTQNDVKWSENSGHSSEEKQNNVHKSSQNSANIYESESDDHNVYNHDTQHQDSDASHINNDEVKEEEKYDYKQNNRNKFNEYVKQRAQTPDDSYNLYHNPKSKFFASDLHNTQNTYHQTSPPNPQNHKRHQTYDGHYSSSSMVGIPKSDANKWEVNIDENNTHRRPETNSWSYENRTDNHKNNNEPVMKSWSTGHGYAYTITQSPVNYESSYFGTHNKVYTINH